MTYKLTGWNIHNDTANINLVEGQDVLRWNFGNKGIFSVTSTYNAMSLIQNDSGSTYKFIWKGKIPEMPKNFFGWS